MTVEWLVFALSLFFIRFLAGYDGRYQTGRACRVKNPFFASLLLDRRSFFERTDRPRRDRDKISIAGISFWVAAALVLLAKALFWLLPDAPLSPAQTDGFFSYATTRGAKISAIAVFLLHLACLGYMLFVSLRWARKIEQKWLKISVYIVLALAALSVAVVGAELLWELGLCFV